MRACAVLGEVGVDGSGAGLQARRVEVGGRGGGGDRRPGGVGGGVRGGGGVDGSERRVVDEARQAALRCAGHRAVTAAAWPPSVSRASAADWRLTDWTPNGRSITL